MELLPKRSVSLLVTHPFLVRYPRSVSLLACPFCREMYAKGEEKLCRHCGVRLERFEDLPASPEALALDGEVPIAPELATLPFSDFRRGRGLLLACAVLGLALFFFPWFTMRFPEEHSFTGFALAAQKLFWVWAAPVAWFVLIPTVLTRRSIFKMRGARVAVAFLAAFPGVTAANLLLHPPRSMRLPHAFSLRVDVAATPALWATLALSVIALLVAFRFGGSLQARKAAKSVPAPRPSASHTLH